MNGYSLFEEHVDKVLPLYSRLIKEINSGGKAFIRGEIDLIDSTGKHWDSYQIEIHHSENYPYRFPEVFETGGKIPRIPDWHIYSDTGGCCLAIPPEEIRLCRNGINLKWFISQQVLPYFFNQTHRKIEGYYKNGEFAHGILGIFQYYDELLNTEGKTQKTVWLLERMVYGRRPTRQDMCFCGKKEKFRKCHRSSYNTLTEIGFDNVKDDISRIKSAFGI